MNRHDPIDRPQAGGYSGKAQGQKLDGDPASEAGQARGQRLDSDNLQDVLDAGANAARVGRQQFFTPNDLARLLMVPLPSARRSFVDFNMGGGAILRAATTQTTLDLYGVDIDSRLARKPQGASDGRELHWHCVCADLTKFYPLLQEVGWTFDLCGLNPPFSVRWHKTNLVALVESERKAVRETFSAGRKPTIDSVLATYLIALDRMTARGEGFVLCSEACARKILETPAGKHVWFSVTITGNDDTKGNVVFGRNVRPFDVTVLYFARSHTASPSRQISCALDALPEQLREVARARQLLRKGLSLFNEYDFCPITRDAWHAAKGEWLRLQDIERGERPDFNIWLRANGTIGRHLTPFQNWSGKIPPQAAEQLNRLAGQTPMSLVVQKATRLALLEAIGQRDASCPWRVDPMLIAAVEKAVSEYHAQRAPFYPLNEVQRLGYLDEEDLITCKREGLLGFEVGQRYELTSETVDIEYHDERLNLAGQPEEVTLFGKELAFYIKDKAGDRHTFCSVPPDRIVLKRGKGGNPSLTITANGAHDGYYHDLHMLIRNFEIPEVRDVAQNAPERYESFVNQIRAIEEKINAAA